MKKEALFKRLHLVVDLPRYYWKSATDFGFHPAAALMLILRGLREGYWPEEAYRLGLLNPAIAASLRKLHVSKRAMVKVQRRLNPPAWENILRDKGIFYRYCQAAGLPVPKLYGIYARGGRGWNIATPVLESDQEWVQFFERDCPSPFVVKPTLGRLGAGVMVLTRTGQGLVPPAGRVIAASELVRHLSTHREFDGFVVQERLRNHPALRTMVAGEGLATSRIISFLHADQRCELLSADLKIVMKDNLTSNLSMGATGNMAGTVSLDDGRILSAVAVLEGEGFVEVERHPETGVPFRDARLPDWGAAKDLVVRAARTFLPVRTVGWDLAFTSSGPVLIEGNFFFDPPCSMFKGREVLRTLTSGL